MNETFSVPAVVRDADARSTFIEEFDISVLWAMFGTLAVLDVGTTFVGLQTGLATESNPVAASLIASHGLFILVPLKAGMLGVWRVSLPLVSRRLQRYVLFAGIAYFSLIVAVNLAVLGLKSGVLP